AGATTAPAPEILHVGLLGDAAPFSSTGRFGARTGFDVDLTLAICEQMGVQCRLITLAPTDLSAALRERRVDMVVASDSRSEQLAEVAALSIPYLSLQARFVVPAEPTADQEGEKEKEGQRDIYGAVFNTPYAAYLLESHPKPGAVILYGTAEEMWIDLALGRITAALATAVTAQKEFLGTPMGKDFRLSSEAITGADVTARDASVAVRQGDDTLLEDVNAALALHMDNPRYAQTLSQELGNGLAQAPTAAVGD
ncbi:MAG: transporter substrate-binding domain-containing protein, partial [Pseudomonadota bacterium]